MDHHIVLVFGFWSFEGIIPLAYIDLSAYYDWASLVISKAYPFLSLLLSLLTFAGPGFNIQSTSFYSDGWTGSENQSVCCCESYKLRQTVPDNVWIIHRWILTLRCDLAFSLLGLSSLCHYVIILSEGASLQQRNTWSELSQVQLHLYPPFHLTVVSLCRWNILMDYCYTTPSGNPNDELRYDLFFG